MNENKKINEWKKNSYKIINNRIMNSKVIEMI